MVTLCLLAAMTCLFDYRFRKIPNELILLMLSWGIVYHLAKGGPVDTFWYVVRGLCCLLFFFLFFLIRALGAGDIKLLGVMAGFFHFEQILVFLFLSFGFALLSYLFWLGLVCCAGKEGGTAGEAGKKMRNGKTVCMAGPILVAFVAVCCRGGMR
ncbi:MAG: prepilin peptidase [Acetatifactor sp.]